MTEKNTRGRPLKFKTPKDLQKSIDDFFDLVKSGQEAPSIAALAYHLGTNKQTILNYQEKDGFREIIEDTKLYIEKEFTAKAYKSEIPQSIFIFTGKAHYGYEEKQSIDLTSKYEVSTPAKLGIEDWQEVVGKEKVE